MPRIHIPLAAVVFLILASCQQQPLHPISEPLGCTDAWSDSVELTDSGAARSIALIHDRQIIAQIEADATKSIDAGKSVKAAQLVEQLKNVKCGAALAKGSDKALSPERVYEQCASSVLVISGIYKCDKCSKWHAAPAGGFVLTESGLAVTNYHVISTPGRETYVARTHDGKMLAIKEVLAASEAHDLAIVQLDLPAGTKLTPLPLAPGAPVGSAVHVISHPDRHFYALTTGIVSRHHVTEKRPGQPVPTLAITADYARGSSGCPVLDARGRVVGIVASTNSVYYKEENGKQENLQMVFKQCVPVESLLKLIEEAK